ncbi:MAG: polysaccharide deacetylase family protein [Clostridia bacterium]|nr:polysaccharide deacetylase family protein [Clostridia bacterium]
MKKDPIAIFVKKRALVFVIIAVFAVGACFALKGTGAYAVYYNSAGRKLPIYSVERADKKIAISFDCAWGAEKTDGLLEVMEKYGVKCTFFTTQFWAEKYPEYVERIYAAGHEIGTHSATHSYMSKLSEERIISELETSSAAIEKITGEKVILFRPPYGDYNDRLIKTCEKQGFYAIQWDVDSLDWKEISAGEIARRVIEKTSGGSVILCHNNAEHTLEALPEIFANLQGRGYEFVKISELIYKENYLVDAAGRQRPAEKT